MATLSPARTTPRWQTYVVYGIMGLLTLAFVASGLTKLAGVQMMADNFARWGLPNWFLYVTGLVEVVSAVLLWPRRTRLYGALGLVGVMLGAMLTHIVNAEPGMLVGPIVLFALAAVVAWTNRPASA